MPDIWIQIENHPWDTVPHRFDRMMGDDYLPTSKLVNLTSPVTGHTRNNVRMYRPVMDGASVADALIFRRYTANWAAPADQKINPWDLNEPDPTDNGTMGTIPGPVIECNVGDTARRHIYLHVEHLWMAQHGWSMALSRPLDMRYRKREPRRHRHRRDPQPGRH